jgi:hypothetical protein
MAYILLKNKNVESVMCHVRPAPIIVGVVVAFHSRPGRRLAGWLGEKEGINLPV